MKSLVRLVTITLFLCTVGFASNSRAPHSSSQYSSRPHSSRTRYSKEGKTVHVRGYTRKDGTYVPPYHRRAPGTATPSLATAGGRGNGESYRRDYPAVGVATHPSVALNKHGKIKRSKAVKAAFERQNPCPSTGRTRGSCPGYVVDHVRALECGGADDPSNMQWQTIAEGKTKDKIERACR